MISTNVSNDKAPGKSHIEEDVCSRKCHAHQELHEVKKQNVVRRKCLAKPHKILRNFL